MFVSAITVIPCRIKMHFAVFNDSPDSFRDFSTVRHFLTFDGKSTIFLVFFAEKVLHFPIYSVIINATVFNG